jgi:2-polyprenyl-3-methyl-5-hydroxy-6-metoxy-1,4-benzoquinol methylase
LRVCSGCNLVRIDPLPTREDLARLYSAETNYHRDLLGPRNGKADHWQRRAAQLARAVGRPASGKSTLLDVGCATGSFLARARAQGWVVSGLEVAEHTSAYARRELGLNVITGAADELALLFEPDSMDVVTLWDVIEHVRDPLDVLVQVGQVLRPGGRLFISTPSLDGWVAQFHFLTLARAWEVWPHPEPPYHVYQFSRKTMERLLEQAGFTSIAFSSDEIPLWYTAGFAAEPDIRAWLKARVSVSRGRWIYLLTAPIHWAARIAGHGDAMIVTALNCPSSERLPPAAPERWACA